MSFNLKQIATAPEKRSFLIVDDMADFREQEKEFIADQALFIGEAGDGREALQRLSQTPYDIILVDLQMQEGMSGHQFMEEIEKNESLRDIPLIVITGSESLEEAIHTFRDHRITDFVPKSKFMEKMPDALKKAQAAVIAAKLPMRNSLLQATQAETAENCLIPHYQLKVHLRLEGARIHARRDSMEALARWKNTLHGGSSGLVSPGEFIPLAEKYRIVNPIDLKILEKVCRQIKAWQKAGLHPRPVAVNLSARQFEDRSCAEKIEHLVGSAEIDPRMIELEITETTYLKYLDLALETISRIKALGIGFAIDDYGAGESVPNRLSDLLPLVSTIKVDGSMVKGFLENPDKANVLEGSLLFLNHLRKKYQIKVVVEMVESAREVRRLLQMDPSLVFQGYYFSTPQPAAQAQRWLQPEGKNEIRKKIRAVFKPPLTN